MQGTAIFPGDSPDLIPGELEDWWQAPTFVHFTFHGNGIDFNTVTGPYSFPPYAPSSELRIKDGRAGEDSLRYDGHSADVSLILLLSEGGEDSLLAGTGGLTGSVPRLSADGNAFRSCAIPPGGSLYAGSCSMFATSAGMMLFNLTALSIQPLTPDPKELLSDLIADVIELNLKAGISNSFDAKLSAATAALDDSQDQNDQAAINAMYAFIHAVNAQRSSRLTDAQANALVTAAQAIIQAVSTS